MSEIKAQILMLSAISPFARLWWVYRIKAMVLNTVSIHAKRDLENGKDYTFRYVAHENEEMSIEAMFWQLTRWRVSAFFSSNVLN